ncbi:MAG: peptide chain release factor N(5)-glutamine methyltransferase [Acidimicrobiales bacterium]
MADRTVTWGELLRESTSRLAEAGFEDADISARRIVEEASGWDGAELVGHLGDGAPVRGVAHLDAMVERRLSGEPLQYVVGRWSFRMLDLMVDRRVLIPRPETEEVAGWAIEEARRFKQPVVVDLGTGSGAIGLSVVTELTGSTVHLTDVSEDALVVTRANLAGLGMAGSRVSVSAGSWFDALPDDLAGSIDVIVSNPPYVSDDDELPPVVRDWEPELALRAGPDGLRDLIPIVEHAIGWLGPSGALVLEMAPSQTHTIAQACLRAGFAEAEVRVDLSTRPRSVVARKRA